MVQLKRLDQRLYEKQSCFNHLETIWFSNNPNSVDCFTYLYHRALSSGHVTVTDGDCSLFTQL
jgi:hypothetical protein